MDQEQAKIGFLQAYDQYADEIYRFCLFKVSDAERASDFTQDVFSRFWQSLRKGTSIDNPRALLFTIARNRITDWYRKKKETSLDALTAEGFEVKGDSSDEVTTKAEYGAILSAIQELDESAREAVLLRFTEGWTPQEIGDLTGETANAVSVRINRALAKVREKLHV